MESTFLRCNETDACIPCHETMKINLLLWLRVIRCFCSAPPLPFWATSSEGTQVVKGHHRKDVKPGLLLQLNLSVLPVSHCASKTIQEQKTNAPSFQTGLYPSGDLNSTHMASQNILFCLITAIISHSQSRADRDAGLRSSCKSLAKCTSSSPILALRWHYFAFTKLNNLFSSTSRNSPFLSYMRITAPAIIMCIKDLKLRLCHFPKLPVAQVNTLILLAAI